MTLIYDDSRDDFASRTSATLASLRKALANDGFLPDEGQRIIEAATPSVAHAILGSE